MFKIETAITISCLRASLEPLDIVDHLAEAKEVTTVPDNLKDGGIALLSVQIGTLYLHHAAPAEICATN